MWLNRLWPISILQERVREILVSFRLENLSENFVYVSEVLRSEVSLGSIAVLCNRRLSHVQLSYS
jgi:hypothetical protein